MRVDERRLTAAYMMASRRHGTLYLGSALDLIERVWDHKQGDGSKFVAKYGVTKLVWYQPFMLVAEARDRECELKKWRRDWKIELIERDNPDWDDLFPVLSGSMLPKQPKSYHPLTPGLARHAPTPGPINASGWKGAKAYAASYSADACVGPGFAVAPRPGNRW